MGVRQRAAAVAALVLASVGGFGRPAMAQSLYVAGAVGADISLVSGHGSFGAPTGGGEAFSGAARLGTVLNDRFGIELEISRAGEILDTSQSGPIPLGAVAPIFLGDVEFRTRITTISTSASIRQQVSDAIALAYLGGIVFHRTDSEMTFRGRPFSGIYTIPPPPVSGFPSRVDVVTSAAPFIFPPSGIESVQYGVGPVVGFEAHIGYGEHFTIIPGVRMHGLPASWLLRPSVAAGWRF